MDGPTPGPFLAAPHGLPPARKRRAATSQSSPRRPAKAGVFATPPSPLPCRTLLPLRPTFTAGHAGTERSPSSPFLAGTGGTSRFTIDSVRGVAQSGSASALGAEGRGFESLRPDHRLHRHVRQQHHHVRPRRLAGNNPLPGRSRRQFGRDLHQPSLRGRAGLQRRSKRPQQQALHGQVARLGDGARLLRRPLLRRRARPLPDARLERDTGDRSLRPLRNSAEPQPLCLCQEQPHHGC
jgi:hypothetical protein